MKITLDHAPIGVDILARMAGGDLILRATEDVPAVTHMCTDSREADGETLLCAIRGERVDGHRFLPGAARAGCRAFLCEHLPDGWADLGADSPMGDAPAAAILVKDTVEALGRLAHARRTDDLSGLAVIGVTGSVGKTTTKEMIASVLSEGETVFKKDGNYNSTIGLPLSVLEIPATAAAAVLEMGMSARGEIAAMAAAVRPNIAVIANIGTSHLEYLGSRENIARAKLEIAAGLSEGGVLLIPANEPLLAQLGQDFSEDEGRPEIPAGVQCLRVGLTAACKADYRASAIHVRDGGMGFDLETPAGLWRDLWIPALGEHLVWAGAFAAAVGHLRGLEASAVRAGLASYRTAMLRQHMRDAGGVTILEDCYNAAPESMRAALGVLTMAAKGRRVAVLGDMRELGADSEALHRSVGAEAARLGVELLVTVGAGGRLIAAGAEAAGMSLDRIHVSEEEAPYAATAAWLCAHIGAGDAILFKASRALALETLSGAVAAKCGENPVES